MIDDHSVEKIAKMEKRSSIRGSMNVRRKIRRRKPSHHYKNEMRPRRPLKDLDKKVSEDPPPKLG